MTMTSMQRLFAAVQHQEADRVPFLHLGTMHPAAAMGLPLKEYFSKGEYVAEGQLELRKRLGHDALVGFFFAAQEVEAFGGQVVFRPDGPPNSGLPFIQAPQDIHKLVAPRVRDSERLAEVLKAIRIMKAAVGDEVPIIGVAMSPFSVPVMQMGFDKYLDLMADDLPLFHRLMEINEQFCVDWANAQLEAGATLIVYFDPVSSPTIVPPKTYEELGAPIASRVLKATKGPVATHFASGRCLPILEAVAATGTVGIGVSAQEDMATLKARCQGRLTLVGNLNGLEMRRWTPAQAEAAVKEVIRKAGKGGGLVLADNHGELPLQVPEEVLLSVSEAVNRWGRYPLAWIDEDA